MSKYKKKLAANKTTIRIFFVVLLMGVIGAGGILLLKYDVDRLSDHYANEIARIYENQVLMDDLKISLYHHQSLVANHLRTRDPEEKDLYEYDNVIVREEMSRALSELGVNVRGGESEQLYHSVYTGVGNYLEYADVVMTLSEEGDYETANYYVSTVMNGFVQGVNDNLAQLEKQMAHQLTEGHRLMNDDILISKISVAIAITIIVIAVVITLFICTRLTASLENYKKNLEDEITAKNTELIKRHERIMGIQNNTVIGMANLIESRDMETGAHIKRTSAYVELLAREAKRRGFFLNTLTDHYIELLVKAAPLHDIGKIIVPDSILQKPGKLTKEEYDIMKRHAAEGGRIVRDVLEGVEDKEYIDIAFDVATYHHEWWSGKGYPAGKVGDDIPLAARIMAIADVFDALVSKRCYKDAFPVEASLRIIKEEGGTHFDPRLTDIFIKLQSDIEIIMDETS